MLSGGQQARFQILLMEIDSPTMLLLDEPTDNLDVASADALEEAIGRYEGTVVAVTHDRWFMRLMDRFLFFDDDGTVSELLESPVRRGRAVTAGRGGLGARAHRILTAAACVAWGSSLVPGARPSR